MSAVSDREPWETPAQWITELADDLVAGRSTPFARLAVPLTYRQGLIENLARQDLRLGEVVADLAAGFVSEQRTGSDGDYYCLNSTRFKVFVQTMPEKDTRVPLALITSVKPRRGPARKGPTASAAVTVHLGYERRRCDIAAVHLEVQRRLRMLRLLVRANAHSAHILSLDGYQQHALADLHAQVRRHYSVLLTMIDLLRQRSDAEDVATARGTVLAPSEELGATFPETVCLRIDERSGEFDSDTTVQVSTADAGWALQLVAVEDELFYVQPPRNAELAPGTPVRLVFKSRFALGRHSYALGRFLRGEVEGDWPALARLLSDPASLPVPAEPFPQPRRFFDDRLNPEQRAAVAGAVGTPHAFFVQGPPGTGKTTVISEIVRQLTARGERVVLLAPMHVAVDEVLRRIGDAPGVLALRVSWDDSRVRADLRRFTRGQLTSEFIRRARTPATSKAPQWQAERDRLMTENRLLAAYETTLSEADDARAARDRALASAAEWRTAHRAQAVRVGRDLPVAEQAAHNAALWFADAEHDHLLAARRLAEAEQGETAWARLLGRFRRGRLAEPRRAYARTAAQLEKTRAERDRSAAWRADVFAAREQLAQIGRDRERWHDRDCAEKARRAEGSDHALSAARHLLLQAGLETAGRAARLESNLQRIDRLGRYGYLERRWFELTGLAQAPSQAERGRTLGELGDQLARSANLVCCTTTGFGGDEDIRDVDYDTLIVDEASRVVDSEFLIGAKQAKRWIMVGDEKQLPPYVESADEHHLHALAALNMAERERGKLERAVESLAQLWEEDEELHRFRADAVLRSAARMRASGGWPGSYRTSFRDAYQRMRDAVDDVERELLRKMREHLVQSLFERCVRDCPGALRQALEEQRRMIDPIAELVRGPVYEGRYRSPDPEVLRAEGVTPLVTSPTFPRPLVLLDTSDDPKAGDKLVGTGFVNALEADWVAAACRVWERELADRDEREVTVSVLTFYRAQAREIRRRLGAPRYAGFRVLNFQVIDAIDRIQGQQSDLVFISFCRTRRGRSRGRPGYGLWLQDVRRLNVACSRARRAIVLVGHRNTLAGLRGVDAAEGFYANMFNLFGRSGSDTIVLKQLGGTGP